MTTDQTYLTKDGLKKLEAELDYLKTGKRQEIADRIQEAKELGDLSENAEYADAKEQQAFNEGRILEVEGIIKNAVLIKNKKNTNGIVSIGSTVVFEDDNSKTQEYKIVGSQEADPVSGLISNESPIGRAFIGKQVGDTVEFQAPRGLVKYKITDVK